jgi:hypothetical protein
MKELLLVGSIPCQTAEQTFRTFGSALGEWLAYIPDGEVGDRRYWIDFIAYKVFNGHPELEVIKRPAPDANGVEQWRSQGLHDQFKFRVKKGIHKVRFGDPGWRIGYARDAANSHAIFTLLKQQGILPKHLRFQVCLPLTYSAVQSYFDEEDLPKVIPGFNEALHAEVAKIIELIPPEDLAIQWDLAVEERLVDLALARGFEVAKQVALQVMEPARDICLEIPANVPLGYHVCFGTLNGWPSRQPKDLTGAVLLANAAVECSARSVDFLHIPTLGSAADEFFKPLAQLITGGARVYMGAIHHLHGQGGLAAQIETIRRYLPGFGLAAPCGFGRAPERPGRLLSETDGPVRDYVGVILKDHKAAIDLLSRVTEH